MPRHPLMPLPMNSWKPVMKIFRVLALVAVTLAGCTRNVYDVELAPAGSSLERKLTVKQQNIPESDPPNAFENEMRRIAEAYGVAAPTPGKSHVFRGRFTGRMPNDVGGYGTFTRWDTPLGAAAVYIERFRGNDDMVDVMQSRKAVADRVADLLVAWLGAELKAEPEWPALRRFLDENLRRDLQNLSILAWSSDLAGSSEPSAERYIRMLQYIVERGYLEPREIPAINRAFADCLRGENERLTTWFAQLIAARAGGGAWRMPERLATPDAVVKSLTIFLETTVEYARLHDEWEQKIKMDPDAMKPDGMAVAGQLVLNLLLGGGNVQLGGDWLDVALKTGRPAVFTNGRWSVDQEKIRWPQQVLGREGFPPIMYAVWDEPDEACQKSHFGAVVLRGQSLLGFCIWYRGLTVAERKEWDAMIDRLVPESNHEKILSDFRFSREPASRNQKQDLEQTGVEEILAGLKKR